MIDTNILTLIAMLLVPLSGLLMLPFFIMNITQAEQSRMLTVNIDDALPNYRK